MTVSNFPFLLLGWLFLALATLGLFLPLLPTTPFVLLSAYFFSYASPRLHRWLLSSSLFGGLLRDWQERGAIKRQTKLIATTMIGLFFAYSIYTMPYLFGKILLLLIIVGVLMFIWTRPE